MSHAPKPSPDDGRLRAMISVVIPTLDEGANLQHLLETLGRERTAAEIIVVDGGSRDDTRALAHSSGAKVLVSPPGRGPQLRAGAAAAAGDIILFLHADSIFPPGGLGRIAATLADAPAVVGGNFRVLFDGDSAFSRWLTGFYAWFRGHGLYYGDSGVFVRREIYVALGGIRPIALMEDYDFTRRLERAGVTCCIAEPPLITSSRRFEGRHPIAIVWGWLKLHALYHLGISSNRLAQIYNSARR